MLEAKVCDRKWAVFVLASSFWSGLKRYEGHTQIY